MEESPRHTCLKLEIPIDRDSEPRETETIFVKGTWYPSHFELAIANGLDAWTCIGSEEDVQERASQWDQPVAEYIGLAEKYLGFQQPGSVYGFSDAGSGHRRLTWTFEKEGTKLEWRWKCQPSSSTKKTTGSVLDFLMDANIRLSEEVVFKADAFEKLKAEAEKCLAQSERLTAEKADFESEVYPKFIVLLNTKKAKLRELRDRMSKEKGAAAPPEDEEESTDKTENFDEESDEGKSEEEVGKNLAGTSKDVLPSRSQAASGSRSRGRKRK